MTTEIAHGSSIISTNEVLLATLSAWHPQVSVYIDPKSDPNVASCMFSVYAVAGGVRTLLHEAGYTYDGNFTQSQRIMNAVPGGGTTIELRAKTNGNATTQAIVGVIVGWDPGEQITPNTEADTGTHTVGGTPTTFATLSQWYPLVDVLVDSTGANPTAIGSKWELVAKFPSIAGFPDTIVDVGTLTDIKQTIFQSEAGGAETFYVQASTQNAQSGNVTAAIVGHTGSAAIAPATEVIVFLDPTSATDIAVGQTYCVKPGGAQNVMVVAYPTALQAAGQHSGIAISAGVRGGFFVGVGAGGNVPASISGLGVGSADSVFTNTNANCIRSSSLPSSLTAPVASGGEAQFGTCTTSGNTTVQPLGVHPGTSTVRALNPKAPPFNCPWDGVHSCDAGFLALMNSIGVPFAHASDPAKIEGPLGLGFFSNDVHIKRNVHWDHRGGGSNASFTSGFLLACKRSLILDSYNTSDDGGTSQYSIIEHFDIQTKTCIVMSPSNAAQYNGLGAGVDIRHAGIFIEAGNVVLYSGATAGANPTVAGSGSHNEVMFRANVGFTPAGAEPAAFATATVANIGNVIVDGAGSWTVEGVPKNRVNSATYVVGQEIFVPGDTRYIYRCTVGGVAGNNASFLANPNFVQPQLYGTFADGGVTWQCIFAGPILNLAVATKIQHFNIFGGTCFGVYLESGNIGLAGSPYVFSDFVNVIDGEIHNAGGGVALHGPDTNGCVIDAIRYYGTATQRSSGGTMGTGEVNVWDRSLGGNSHYNIYPQGGIAPDYVADSALFATPATPAGPGPFSTFAGCKGENSMGYKLYSPTCILGTMGNAGASSDSTATSLVAENCFNITEKARSGGLSTEVALLEDYNSQSQAVCQVLLSGDTNGLAWWCNTIGANSIGTGWMARGYGPSQLAGAPRPITGESNFGAKNTGAGPGPGIGLFRIYDGYFNGRSATTYEGTASASLTSATIRYGLRNVGDRFFIPSFTNAVGTYRKVTVTTQGYRAPLWTNATAYQVELDVSPFFTEATQVEQSTQPAVYSDGTGKVWRFISGPGNSGVEPIWPAIAKGSTFVDAAGNTWKYIDLTAVVENSEIVDDVTIAYTPQTRSLRTDTASTINLTAPKEQLSSFDIQPANTTTNAANQLLTTIDASFFGLAAGNLPDNSVYVLDFTLSGKSPAGNAEVGSCKYSATLYMNGGNLVRVGTDDNFPKFLSGTTVAIDIATAPKQIGITVSPGVNSTVEWGIEGQISRRFD